ncbi:MAG: ABC transporter substrate-binding protein [Gemmatimonadetes bacterium]|nr:ABC transporter substrate-binding protein [Gemmatimonadota bacterium]
MQSSGDRSEGVGRVLSHQRVLLCAISALLLGCSPAPPSRADEAVSSGPAVIDDAGREVKLSAPARRVVSLLPAGTETLVALGAIDWIVGRTRYDSDAHLAHLPSVGGGLDPSLEALTALSPDLVITFETAGGSPVRARLEQLGIPVFAIQTQDTSDVFRNIQKLGHLVGREAAADSLSRDLRTRLDAVRAGVPPGSRPTVLYVAGLDPPIVAGNGTFVMELIGVAGGAAIPALSRAAGVWPQLSFEELVRQDPDIVMLPVGREPAQAVERLRAAPGWRELSAVREGRIVTVDADLANRPGPAIAQSAEAMRAALAPHLERQ